MSNPTNFVLFQALILSLTFNVACQHSEEGALVFVADDNLRGPTGSNVKGDDVNEPEAPFLIEGSPDALALLAFINDESTTEATLDFDVNLDRRAAYWIVTTRNGVDQRYPSADDRLITSIQQLGMINFVGQTAIRRLLTYVTARAIAFNDDGTPLIGAWDGVSFTEDEANATLSFANSADFDELDIDANIKRDTAEAIVNNRPFDHVRELANTPKVGEATLTLMREYAVLHYTSTR